MDFEERLDETVERAADGERFDVAALVEPLPEADRRLLLAEARRRMEALPVPIGPRVRDRAARERRALARVAGFIEALAGRPEALLAVAREEWLAGGEHADYLRLLVRFGMGDHAAVLARSLLDGPGSAEARAALENVLVDVAGAPEGFREAVERFAAAPSDEAWEGLHRFVPPDRADQTLRLTVRLLTQLGVDGDVIFHYAALRGSTVDVVELAEQGSVSPHVIAERAADAPGPLRPLWLGLAARAACIRGDYFGTARFLREAYDRAEPGMEPSLDLEFIRYRADDELHELLDRAGLPRDP